MLGKMHVITAAQVGKSCYRTTEMGKFQAAALYYLFILSFINVSILTYKLVL